MTRMTALGVLLVLCGCRSRPVTFSTAAASPSPAVAETGLTDEINPRLLRRFQPVDGDGAPVQANADRIDLGRMLFYEKRLSRGHDISCNSCHALDRFGIDGRTTSRGDRGQVGSRNAPTVFNAAAHIAQFWDGRAPTVEHQAMGPIMNPGEMAMPSERAVIAVLESIPEYVTLFAKAFPGEPKPISLKNIGAAIGAFERGLVTTSRWDRFVAGDKRALTAQEKQGLRVFLEVGCTSCHTGPQVGGTMFQKVGAVVPWPNQKDEGRAAITKSPADRMFFKVPTLKNITKTSPYFHDGSAANLEDAIILMGRHQLGIKLTDTEVKAIAAWMVSMTGEVDRHYVAEPVMPKSTSRTPRPM